MPVRTTMLALLAAVLACIHGSGGRITARKLGAYDVVMETRTKGETKGVFPSTPVMWHGELLLAESILCRPAVPLPAPAAPVDDNYIRVRRANAPFTALASVVPQSVGFSFVSATVVPKGPSTGPEDTLWLFGTYYPSIFTGSCGGTVQDPARPPAAPNSTGTTKQKTAGPWKGFTNNFTSQVYGWWSSDPLLKHWNRAIVLELPPAFHHIECSVTMVAEPPASAPDTVPGPASYAMAIAIDQPASVVGKAMTTAVFARCDRCGGDLSKGWALLDGVFSNTSYNACPTLRHFHHGDGTSYYYYSFMTLGWPAPKYTGWQLPTFVARSTDLVTWEVSAHALMAPDNETSGSVEHTPQPGGLLDARGSEQVKGLLKRYVDSSVTRLPRSALSQY